MIKVAIGLFVLGLSFGSGPCLASCGPLLLSFIAGTRKNIFKSLLTYTLFSVSRIAVYVLLSLLIYFLGRFVFTKVWVGFLRYLVMLGGIFIIILGLIIALGKSYKFKWCGSKKSVLI
ncbi:MAG: sulfite exporter TauE/SafE family protein, partial [Candidatus Omnitrophica bacterium]|nr:sulfite exporter TauE/SafE family protein [Candidatus Omnitrophota bacterium]